MNKSSMAESEVHDPPLIEEEQATGGEFQHEDPLHQKDEEVCDNVRKRKSKSEKKKLEKMQRDMSVPFAATLKTIQLNEDGVEEEIETENEKIVHSKKGKNNRKKNKKWSD